MKTIVDGVIYDTETAKEITSETLWSLYQTAEGKFFEVVDGGFGVGDKINPLTDKQARHSLELSLRGSDLVAEYFGPTHDPGPPRFSRRTVVAAIEAIEGRVTHAALTRRLLKWSPELNARCDSGASPDRFNHLIKFFDEQPHFRLDDGNFLADEVVEHAASLLDQFLAPSFQVDAFKRALDLDGFSVTDGVLRRTLPSTLKLPEAVDEISQLLTKHRLAVAQGHLKQAFENHADGNWAAANSQIRTFLEGLLDEIAARITPSAASLPSGHQRRMELARQGFFIRALNEWDDNGLGFMNGLVAREVSGLA
jgi:hypothetical protein